MCALNSIASDVYVIARCSSASYPLAVPRTLGENIRDARTAAGIKTQGAFAKMLGVPQPQVSDWENNRYQKIELKNLLKIAASIPCTVETLVQGVDAQYDASRDLLEQGRTGHSGSLPRQGESDVPASARKRIAELESEVAQYKARLEEAKGIAARLVHIAAGKTRTATGTTPGPRGRRR